MDRCPECRLVLTPMGHMGDIMQQGFNRSSKRATASILRRLCFWSRSCSCLGSPSARFC